MCSRAQQPHPRKAGNNNVRSIVASLFGLEVSLYLLQCHNNAVSRLCKQQMQADNACDYIFDKDVAFVRFNCAASTVCYHLPQLKSEFRSHLIFCCSSIFHRIHGPVRLASNYHTALSLILVMLHQFSMTTCRT